MKKDKQLKQLNDAYNRLKEALNEKFDNPLAIDGSIQRFEFCFELVWKTLKSFLEDEGISCNSPKSSLQQAYRIQLIDNEDAWLKLLKARNLTVHVYDENMAKEIYNIIKAQHPLIGELIEKLNR